MDKYTEEMSKKLAELLEEMTVEELQNFFKRLDKEAEMIEASMGGAVQLPRFPQELRQEYINKKKRTEETNYWAIAQDKSLPVDTRIEAIHKVRDEVNSPDEMDCFLGGFTNDEPEEIEEVLQQYGEEL